MIKIKIHSLTYFILLTIMLCGYLNYFLIISFIIIMHDFGHLLLMKIFKIKIYDITVLPFGSIINSKINYNFNSNKMFYISIAGIIIQLFLYPFMYLMYNMSIINVLSYNIFLYYNKIIIIFNLIPIIPLDGSNIVVSFFERFLPYKLVLKLINYISLLLIFILFFLNKINMNLVLMTVFLFVKTYEKILNHNFIFTSFLLERYLKEPTYIKIKYVNSIKKIYKNRYNFINNQKESSVLAKMFDN